MFDYFFNEILLSQLLSKTYHFSLAFVSIFMDSFPHLGLNHLATTLANIGVSSSQEASPLIPAL